MGDHLGTPGAAVMGSDIDSAMRQEYLTLDDRKRLAYRFSMHTAFMGSKVGGSVARSASSTTQQYLGPPFV